jgi:hypothetical protein
MSSGSSGDVPKYSSFDPNALADGKRSDEWTGLKGQPSTGKKKANEAAREPEIENQNKKANSAGEKAASLILRTHWELALLTFAVQVQCVIAEHNPSRLDW